MLKTQGIDTCWHTDSNMNITHNTTEYFIRAEVNCAAQITSTFADRIAGSAGGSSVSWNENLSPRNPEERDLPSFPLHCLHLQMADISFFQLSA